MKMGSVAPPGSNGGAMTPIRALVFAALLSLAGCADQAAQSPTAPQAAGGSAPTVSVGGSARAYYGQVR